MRSEKTIDDKLKEIYRATIYDRYTKEEDLLKILIHKEAFDEVYVAVAQERMLKIKNQ